MATVTLKAKKNDPRKSARDKWRKKQINKGLRPISIYVPIRHQDNIKKFVKLLIKYPDDVLLALDMAFPVKKSDGKQKLPTPNKPVLIKVKRRV